MSKINLKPVRDGIKLVIKEYKAECEERIVDLKRYDEFNMYGNATGYKTLVRLEDVLQILREND